MDRSTSAGVSASAGVPAGTSPDRRAAFVNHFFAVLDQETADAVSASKLLRESGDFSVKRVEADGGQHWTGRYLIMESTYVELFGPDDADDVACPGSIGIALGGDTIGMLDEIDQRLKMDGHPSLNHVRRRMVAGEEVDWFRIVGPPDEDGPPDAGPTVDAWWMEYVASFMDRPDAGKGPSHGPADVISRRRYNAPTYHDGLMRDLTSARFALAPMCFRTRVKPLLVASDFHVVESGDGAVARGVESELHFTFVPRASTALRALRFRLGRSVPVMRSESIGRSVLVVGPGTEATWTFDP